MAPAAALKAELIAKLTETLDALKRAHHDTTEGATHDEAKPENDKDTRAIEASYLARGQAMRIESLAQGLAQLEALVLKATGAVGLGSVVDAVEGKRRTTYFVAPEGGGLKLASGSVQVVTPSSLLGQALMGKQVGDVAELTIAGKQRELELTHVR